MEKKIKDLKAGDKVKGDSGKWLTVTSIKVHRSSVFLSLSDGSMGFYGKKQTVEVKPGK